MCKWHSFDPYSGVVYVWVLELLLCKKERHRRFYRACGKSNEVQNCPCTIVHEIARMHTHAQCTMHARTLCITQLRNVHKVEDGACGNKAQAVDPIEHRHTGTRSHWAELGKSQLQVHTCTHCRRSHWGDLGNHSLCERISDSKAEASQKTSRPGNLANKLFKREVSTSPNWQSDVTVMEMCQTEWWLMPEL